MYPYSRRAASFSTNPSRLVFSRSSALSSSRSSIAPTTMLLLIARKQRKKTVQHLTLIVQVEEICFDFDFDELVMPPMALYEQRWMVQLLLLSQFVVVVVIIVIYRE